MSSQCQGDFGQCLYFNRIKVKKKGVKALV